MLESAVERHLVEGVRKLGGRAYKFVSPGHSGVPDRLVILPGARVIFVELKTEVGEVTLLQEATHRELRKLGCAVRVLYGTKDVDKFLEELR